jgi:hypothetical protein
MLRKKGCDVKEKKKRLLGWTTQLKAVLRIRRWQATIHFVLSQGAWRKRKKKAGKESVRREECEGTNK